MTVEKLNDAPVLDQLEPYWVKIAALLIWKLAKKDELVTFASKDMEQFEKDWPEGAIIATLGAQDSFSFKLVSPSEAERIKLHNETQRGSS